MDKNIEKMIKSMDNPNYKGVKVFVDELEKIDKKDVQKVVNDLYKNLSETGIQKLDKVINIYNKNHDALIKTHNQVMNEYKPEIDNIVALINKYSDVFECKNKKTDDFIRGQFQEYLSGINEDDIQEVIDEVSRNISEKNEFRVLSIISKQYGEEHSIRIRVSDIIAAEKEAENLIMKYKEDLKKYTKDSAINKFKYSILKMAQSTKNPDLFQATINTLDKKLDFDSRKALDSAIRLHNKHIEYENKFETRRVVLSDNIKDKSWQKLEAESFLSRKLKEFRTQLKKIKKDLEKPQDKYDSGILNASIRAIINLQNLIKETFDFIKKSVEYKMNLNEKMEKRDLSPFYDIIKDAYKEKGNAIIYALNENRISKQDAEKLFVSDMSYIMSYGHQKKNELSSIYAESISNSLKSKDISIETKNTFLNILLKYENGEFDKEINENVKKGFKYDDSQFFKFNSENNEKTKKDKLNHNNKNQKNDIDIKNKTSEKKKAIITSDIYAKEAKKIGESIANHGFSTADDAMKQFVYDMGSFSYNHNELTRTDIDLYTKIAAVYIMQNIGSTNKKFYKEMLNNLSQFNDKNFKISSSKSQIMTLLKAASKVDIANSIQEHSDNVLDNENVFMKDINTVLRNALNGIENKEQQQNFISGVADQINSERMQYIFAISSRQFGLRSQIHDNKKSTYNINKQIDSLADKYIKQTQRYNKNINTQHDFIALCDRIPETMGAGQKVYDELQLRLSENDYAINLLQNDKDAYNQLNIDYGLDIIVDSNDILNNAFNINNTDTQSGIIEFDSISCIPDYAEEEMEI